MWHGASYIYIWDTVPVLPSNMYIITILRLNNVYVCVACALSM